MQLLYDDEIIRACGWQIHKVYFRKNAQTKKENNYRHKHTFAEAQTNKKGSNQRDKHGKRHIQDQTPNSTS